MKHALLMSAAAALALCGAAAPGVAGIVGNTSFSHEIPVRVPAGAQVAQLRTGVSTPASSGPASSAAAGTKTPALSGTRSSQTLPTPTRDRPTPTRAEPTHHASAAEPGDDRGRGGRTGQPTAPRSSGGDDRSGHGSGHGSSRGSSGSGSGKSGGSDDSGGGRHGGDG